MKQHDPFIHAHPLPLLSSTHLSSCHKLHIQLQRLASGEGIGLDVETADSTNLSLVQKVHQTEPRRQIGPQK